MVVGLKYFANISQNGGEQFYGLFEKSLKLSKGSKRSDEVTAKNHFKISAHIQSE